MGNLVIGFAHSEKDQTPSKSLKPTTSAKTPDVDEVDPTPTQIVFKKQSPMTRKTLDGIIDRMRHADVPVKELKGGLPPPSPDDLIIVRRADIIQTITRVADAHIPFGKNSAVFFTKHTQNLMLKSVPLAEKE